MHSTARNILTAAAIVVAAIGLSVGTAQADPPSGVTPKATDIVGVGDQTTQGVMDQIASDYNAQSPAPTNKLYSFDAVGSTSITTKSGCSTVTRPNGSSAGILALKNSARAGSSFCIDFVRSSRAGAPGDASGGNLAFIPFAKDAVTWSATTTSAKPTHAVSSLSLKQLQAIYACNASLLNSSYPSTSAPTWAQLGGTSNDVVVPVIPQPSSGTRDFFLGAIQVGSSSQPALGSCVQNSSTASTVEENEGTNAIFSGSNSQDLVFPYSIADYLAQSQNGHGTGTQGNQVLRSVTNTSGTAVAPTTGTAPNMVINNALTPVGVTRNVFNVVRDNGTSTHVPTYEQAIFGSGPNTGYICTNTTAQNDIKSYGFLSLGSSCGTAAVQST